MRFADEDQVRGPGRRAGDTTRVRLFPAGSKPATRVQLGCYVADLATITAELDRLKISYELPMIHRLNAADPDGNRVHLIKVATALRSRRRLGLGRLLNDKLAWMFGSSTRLCAHRRTRARQACGTRFYHVLYERSA